MPNIKKIVEETRKRKKQGNFITGDTVKVDEDQVQENVKVDKTEEDEGDTG